MGQRVDSAPDATISGLDEVTQLSSGIYHVCARRSDGTVRCWGDNGQGQTAGSTPTRPVAGLSGAVKLFAGGSHTCAVVAHGGVVCWGDDSQGQVSETPRRRVTVILGP